MLPDTLGELIGAHHGDPTLYERDLELLKAFGKWVETVRKWREKGNPGWLPTIPDMLKSRLFWRIRTGKEPLPEPPPCSFSCPWYEVIEDCVPHCVGWESGWAHVHEAGAELFGKILEKGFASLNQEHYTIEEKRDNEYMVSFGNWRFRLFPGTYQQRYLDHNKQGADRTVPCWYLQRMPEWEIAKYE